MKTDKIIKTMTTGLWWVVTGLAQTISIFLAGLVYFMISSILPSQFVFVIGLLWIVLWIYIIGFVAEKVGWKKK